MLPYRHIFRTCFPRDARFAAHVRYKLRLLLTLIDMPAVYYHFFEFYWRYFSRCH